MNLSGATRACVLLTDVDATLRASLDLASPNSSPPQSLQSVVRRARDTTERAMAKSPGSGQATPEPELISQSLSLQLTLQRFMSERRAQIIRSLPFSIRRLTGTEDKTIARQICLELISSGGFGRAVYSDVEGLIVRPAHAARASDDGITDSDFSDDHDFDAGPGSVEYTCLTAAGPPLLADDAHAHPAMADMLDSTDYVVAPILASSTVIGMLHVAARAPLAIDGRDLECLGVYQGAAGAAFSRDAWSEVAVGHYTAVRQAVTAVVEDAGRIISADFEIGGVTSSDAQVPRLQSPAINFAIEESLTKRETEVMRLIAQGLSNAEIAERLFIGVETVKSHVKKVLRKIGAVNRSEAISLYLDNGNRSR